MKKNKKLIVFASVVIALLLVLFGVWFCFLAPVGGKEKVKVVIEPGTSRDEIAVLLKENKLIKSTNAFKLFLKLKDANNIYAATYYMSKDMSLCEIIDELSKGGVNENEIQITFLEGNNIRNYAKVISESTNNTEDDVYTLLKDKDYLKSLIEKYWFISDDILNSKIYYPLEGYLFPETYRFSDKNVSVATIFETMLDEMGKHLDQYKDLIQKSNYSIHELLTLASITQSEGYNEDDFKNIASVFYNRLNDAMPLGSCVTSYYGVKKEMTEELFVADINAVNPYNTRGNNPVKFPVGPISNPGSNALVAVLNPIKTDYYYFVSDVNHKLYFTKSNEEHEAKISELMNEGLWYEW